MASKDLEMDTDHVADVIHRVADKQGDEKFEGEWDIVQSSTKTMISQLAEIAENEQDPSTY